MAEHVGTAPSPGLIRNEHAIGGWELRSFDGGRNYLVKSYADYRGRIEQPTTTTCAWRIADLAGKFRREASARDVETAKSAADAWVAAHSTPAPE